MDKREERLREEIDFWLGEKEKAAQMVRHFRDALATYKGKPPKKSRKRPSKNPKRRSAKELSGRVNRLKLFLRGV